MNSQSTFSFEYALVRTSIPESTVNGISMNSEHEPVDLQKARAQHQAYLDYLRQSGVKLIELQGDEAYPDCVFVEDTSVALGNRVLVTNMIAASRSGETQEIKRKFSQIAQELSLEVFEVQDKEEAFIDGGDVCFTGREFLVGLTKRTNLKGAEELQRVFPEYQVTTCEVIGQRLHLKSMMTMCDQDTILIGRSDEAQAVLKQIKEKAKYGHEYKFIEVDLEDKGSANVLLFNGHLLYPAGFDELYQKEGLFESKIVKQFGKMYNQEFAKLDGALTCRSVFFNRGSTNSN